ncbi:MAG: DUF2332 domain-containing protein [Jatrophihabitantaceae bacterium]
MAERQLRGISPSYEAICLGVADDTELIELLDTLPAPKRQPNLLLGAVRFLGGPVDSFAAFRSWLLGCWDEVAATMLERRTQTNEARRCVTLLPVLAALRQPLALLEVGASAGLCLYPDRYAYQYGDRPVLGASDLVLSCRVSGLVPIPDRLPDVAWRAGLDLNPLDVNDDEDVRWLESLIWPEQLERLQVLRAAVVLAREDGVAVRRGNLLTDLAAVAGDAPEDATLVLFHSAVLAYLTGDQRARFRADVARLATERPTVWVSNGGPGIATDLPVPEGLVPFVLARDGSPLATASPHREWLHWLRA